MTWEWFHITQEEGKKLFLRCSGRVVWGGKHFNLDFPRAEVVIRTSMEFIYLGR